MGYLTSSGCIGVAFNDGSGLLAAAGLRSCEYRQKSARARSDAGAAGAAVLVPHGGPGAGFTQPAGLDERIGKKLLTLILTLTLTLNLILTLTLTLTLTRHRGVGNLPTTSFRTATTG